MSPFESSLVRSLCRKAVPWAFWFSLASTAIAAPADRSAQQKIERAVEQHYLMTEFDEAKALLVEVTRECEAGCSPRVAARAWIYLGIVEAAGNQDEAAAREAFVSALAIHPEATLDPDLTTVETERAFEAAQRSAVTAPPSTSGPNPVTEGAAEPRAEAPPEASDFSDEVLCPPDFPGCESTGAGSRFDEQEAESHDEPRGWLGVHVAQDFTWFDARNACAVQAQLDNDLHCFEYDPASGGRDLPFPGYRANGDIGDPYPGQGIGGGFVPATTRVLLSYDHRLWRGLHGGVRAGYAFGGGPRTRDGAEFFPVHLEGRLSYWFGSGGLRPYLFLGGGIAQVDARAELQNVRDCTTLPQDPNLPNPEQPFQDCIAGDPQEAGALEPFTVDVWKKVGQGFVKSLGGVVFQFHDSVAVQLDLGVMLMMPSSGLVLEPSLGVLYAP